MIPIEKREHFAKIRREVVLHRMATADSLDDRLFWGMILWSWCGPETSRGVVLKDAKGFIRKDNFDKPIPAKQKDLLELLGLRPKWKGHVSAAIKRLVAKNSIHFEGDVLYPDQEPALPNPQNLVTSTRNFYIGSRHISTGNLPAEPEARKRAIQWLEKTSTEWNGDLKELRTRYHELLEQAAPELGILYVLKEKKSIKEEESSSAVVSKVQASPRRRENRKNGANNAEEDGSLYQKFKESYPDHPIKHFDEPKAKPFFDGKTKAEQALILERLQVYLSCERWQDEDGKYIPLASNWLQAYEADPPPRLNIHRNGRKELAPVDEVLELVRRNREAGI